MIHCRFLNRVNSNKYMIICNFLFIKFLYPRKLSGIVHTHMCSYFVLSLLSLLRICIFILYTWRHSFFFRSWESLKFSYCLFFLFLCFLFFSLLRSWNKIMTSSSLLWLTEFKYKECTWIIDLFFVFLSLWFLFLLLFFLFVREQLML